MEHLGYHPRLLASQVATSDLVPELFPHVVFRGTAPSGGFSSKEVQCLSSWPGAIDFPPTGGSTQVYRRGMHTRACKTPGRV